MTKKERNKLAQEKYRTTPKAKACRQRHRNTHKGRITTMYREAKRRSEERGLEWDLELCEVMVPDVCPVLGIPLFFTVGRTTDNTPTLDRVDNTKGYTRDNVVVISYRANRIKNDSTLDELVAVTVYVAEHLTPKSVDFR